MSADKIIVLVGGIMLIIFIHWFFLGKKRKKVMVTNNEIDVTVSGGYLPESITIIKGQSTTINFTRTDTSACLEEVVLADFNIRQFLPLNQKVSVVITPEKVGKFAFSCGMGMFHGTIEVVDEA